MLGALLVASALPAHAQIGRSRVAYNPDPKYWVGLSYGYVDGLTLSDESTNSTWRFAYSSQIRATLEKTIQRGVTLGAAAGFTSARLTYASTGNTCLSCAARADITQYTVFFRNGGGVGFHGMYNVEAGVTRFANFRERDTDAALPPGSPTNDITLGFGGGFAYGFSNTSSVYLNPQWYLVLHPQPTETGGGSAPRLLVYRAGFRMGF
jgi:hypothetical protein